MAALTYEACYNSLGHDSNINQIERWNFNLSLQNAYFVWMENTGKTFYHCFAINLKAL